MCRIQQLCILSSLWAPWRVMKRKGQGQCVLISSKPTGQISTFRATTLRLQLLPFWLKQYIQRHSDIISPIFPLIGRGPQRWGADLLPGLSSASVMISTCCNVSHTLWIQFVWVRSGESRWANFCREATRWQCGSDCSLLCCLTVWSRGKADLTDGTEPKTSMNGNGMHTKHPKQCFESSHTFFYSHLLM